MADTNGSNSEANCLEKLKSYVRTPKGMILAAEIIISLILICIALSWHGGYSTVPICEMVFATIFFCVYMMDLDKQFQEIFWAWSDFFRAATGAGVYLITSLICVIGGHEDGARMAGGIIGLFAGLLFAYDAYTLFLQLKSARQHTAASTDVRV